MKALITLLFLFLAFTACRAAYPTPTPSPTPLSPRPAAQPTVAPTPSPTPTPTAYATPSPMVYATPSPTPAPTGTVVKVSPYPQLGPMLTDARGRTLYLFTRDTPNKSTCTGACAQAWPPLLTTAAPVPGPGVNTALLGTTQRPDGSTQVTYNGWPLYYFASDQNPGDARGQGVGGVWFVVSPAGTPLGLSPTPPTAPPTPTPPPPSGGTPTPTPGDTYRY